MPTVCWCTVLSQIGLENCHSLCGKCSAMLSMLKYAPADYVGVSLWLAGDHSRVFFFVAWVQQGLPEGGQSVWLLAARHRC